MRMIGGKSRAGDLPDLDLEEDDGRSGIRRMRRYRIRRPRRRRDYRAKR